jgi:cell division protein FtsQ
MNAVVSHPIDIRLMNLLAVVLGLVALSLSLIYSLRWVATWPVFSVKRIVVDGDTNHHNALTIKANVTGRIDGGFYSTDLTHAKRVFESIPWIRRAVVRREFPGQLRVTLEEHRSSAFWGGEHESRMVNSYGEIFDANVGDAESDALPRLLGSDTEAAAVLDMYRRLSQLLSATDTSIDQLELTGRRAWRMQLDTGTDIELGRGDREEVIERFENFLRTHERVLATYGRVDFGRIETLDLRNGQGYAIRIRGVSTATAFTPEKK